MGRGREGRDSMNRDRDRMERDWTGLRGTRWGGEGQNGMERERDREGRNKKKLRGRNEKKN